MEQLLKFINSLSPSQRAVVIGGFSLLFIFLAGLLVYTSVKAKDERLNYTIASELTKSQVMLAGNELEASGIPFSVIGSGNSLTLKTSKKHINIAKIKLVTSEAATSRHTGWEIFEKSSLGTTNFENKIKYLRALEGELSRSLESLSVVLSASVKIALPKETIFTQRKTPPTASAVLMLKPGLFLTQKQIDGIKNFISSAIPNLSSENIKLIDQDGSMLEHSKRDADTEKFKTQDKYKKNIEESFEEKVVALLEPFVGTGRVVARVSVDLDFTQQKVQEEIYEPEGTIRSQQTVETNSKDEEKDSSSGSGVAGVKSNIQNPNDSDSSLKLKSSKEEARNTVNYEISKKIVNKENGAYATIKRVSAAVTFDSAVLKDIENQEEFMDSIRSVVQDTIGFDKERGDQVSVKNFKFIKFHNITVDGKKLDENGQVVVDANGIAIASNGSAAGALGFSDNLSMVKTILDEFGEYIQYLIAGLLLLIFYRKFIAKHEIMIIGDRKKEEDDEEEEDDLFDFEEEFDETGAHQRLKSKVKSQILNNIDGLDEESAAKYEVLIEELDKKVSNSPAEVAGLIELLLTEGDEMLKGGKK
jgi:flagellar M-ring protein FliF